MQTSMSRFNLRPSKKFLQNSKKQSSLKVTSAEWHSTLEYQIVCIDAEMSPEEQAELLQFLDKNIDVFAWSTSNLVGVSREVMKHKLHVNPHAKPKKQKLRKMSEEKVEATS
jgi:hypothetical protein